METLALGAMFHGHISRRNMRVADGGASQGEDAHIDYLVELPQDAHAASHGWLMS
jgi:hypothetical protein